MSEKKPTHPYRQWDHSLKTNGKPKANGKTDRHMTPTGRVEKLLEERELRKLETPPVVAA